MKTLKLMLLTGLVSFFLFSLNGNAQAVKEVKGECIKVEPSAIMYPECGKWIKLADPVEICWKSITRNIPGGNKMVMVTMTFKGRVYNSVGAEVAFSTMDKSLYLLNGNGLEFLNEISVGSIGGMQILAKHHLEISHDGVVTPVIENLNFVCKE